MLTHGFAICDGFMNNTQIVYGLSGVNVYLSSNEMGSILVK